MYKILIVDDSDTMRQILKNIIKSIPEITTIVEKKNGLEGKNAVQEENFDLILTDWNMPELTGLEFVEYLKGSSSSIARIPVVMITTEGLKEQVITAIKAGVNDYIIKPFTPVEVTKKVKKLLSIK